MSGDSKLRTITDTHSRAQEDHSATLDRLTAEGSCPVVPVPTIMEIHVFAVGSREDTVSG